MTWVENFSTMTDEQLDRIWVKAQMDYRVALVKYRGISKALRKETNIRFAICKPINANHRL